MELYRLIKLVFKSLIMTGLIYLLTFLRLLKALKIAYFPVIITDFYSQ